ncbi:MAG: bifunctional 3,4-dihydroxy-2-butanone-4-phosphate synthase/GTP cyclohydrolase II [Ignavibacteria bacterium]|nr:bifunctional 3,4-dihydroxy-2-butanone-4-phosphate synthase/GTP cyclohydrolase II [Ignavibacteria bacterium]
MKQTFDSIEQAIKDLQAGKVVVVLDDEDRENEGDIICAAEFCTPEQVNFMASQAKGLICVALPSEKAIALDLAPMVPDNTALHGTKFTVSIDYLHGTSSGISASDRSATIKALVQPNITPDDFGRPGHIFPLIAVEEGVLRRAGHTEAVVDLMKLGGLQPVGVLCEILAEDGTMMRTTQLMEFSEKHQLSIITVKDLIRYRLNKEQLVTAVAKAKLPTEFGDFMLQVFANTVDGKEHVALVKGTWNEDEPILVRVHSECLTGDIFHSLRCDCGPQLSAALSMIQEAEQGVLLYMRQEGRGIGLVNKVKAYSLQEQGLDTVEANEQLGFQPDPRDYGIGAQILASLGVRKMKLLTNNPTKRVGLESYGLEVVERVPIEMQPNSVNRDYLETKKVKMGHLLTHL